MAETFDQRLSRLTAYFEGHLREISQLDSNGDHVAHYKRVLYITVLSALSKIVVPNTRDNDRQRMVHLLSNFSEWGEYNRISLPHLVKLLNLTPEPAFEALRLYAIKQYNSWIIGDVITLDRDPSYIEIANLWPADNEYKFSIKDNNRKIPLESLQHVYLFYTHRNSLVHEFRMLGLLSGDPAPSKNEPHYSALFHDAGGDIITWELQYPLEFYRRITERCLTNLSEYLRRNQIDPVSFFTSNSYWISELNTY
ncbi:MAG: hypothetical protein HY258_04285 [Chloroflexi bacterium]|nr:hypothetical protein [Chloroflexota bacterium]